jgi:hypothetical protein
VEHEWASSRKRITGQHYSSRATSQPDNQSLSQTSSQKSVSLGINAATRQPDNILIISKYIISGLFIKILCGFLVCRMRTGRDFAPGLWVEREEMYYKQWDSGCSCNVGKAGTDVL